MLQFMALQRVRHNWMTEQQQQMFLPVVILGSESWTIKKAKHLRIDAFKLWFWRRLERPLVSKEIKPVNLKGDQP